MVSYAQKSLNRVFKRVNLSRLHHIAINIEQTGTATERIENQYPKLPY